jgi:hypothetical protein
MHEATLRAAAALAWLSKYAASRFGTSNEPKSTCAKLCVRNVFAMPRAKTTGVETMALKAATT